VNLEALEIEKNILNSLRPLQGNDVRVHLCLHCITVNNKNNNNLFFCLKIVTYFFHVHLNILDTVVSS
jgi:hypothetical protein